MAVPPFHPGQQVRDRTNPIQPGTVLSIELDDQLDVWIVCARFGSRRTAVGSICRKRTFDTVTR